jgi:hypothetical protein
VVPAEDWDRNSAKLWDAANVLETVGVILGFAGIGRIQTQSSFIGPFGLTLLLMGISLRYAAINTLGEYFI